MKNQLEQNKQNAVLFYERAYKGNPSKAVELYVGEKYTQHNPLVGNGIQPFIEYFDKMAIKYPNKSIKFVRIVAEGELVVLHTHQIWPDNIEYVTMDFFLDLTTMVK